MSLATALKGAVGAAVRLGDCYPGKVSGEQSRYPPRPGRGACMAGDESAVPKTGRVAQIDVAISADELGQLPHRRAVTEAVRDQLPGANY